MNALLIAMSRPRRARRLGSCAGASVIEMALIVPLLLTIIFGALTASMLLDRILTVLQVVRYAGSMYARGTDFNVAANKVLLLKGAGGLGITPTGGTGVIYLTTVVKPLAASANGKAGRFVIAERFVIGNPNPPYPASHIGTPSGSFWPDTTKPLPNGQVRDYDNQPSAVATLPAAFVFANIGDNERIFVVEVCDNLTDLGGYMSLFSMNQFYTRAFF